MKARMQACVPSIFPIKDYDLFKGDYPCDISISYSKTHSQTSVINNLLKGLKKQDIKTSTDKEATQLRLVIFKH
jgi:hypothetical protein